MDEQQKAGEELFDRLAKEKKQRRRRVVRTVVLVIAVIAVILVLLVLSLRRSVEQRFAAAEKEVLTYEVAPGTIHALVSGSGLLEQEDTEKITVPAGVTIDEVIAEAGDPVQTGDLLAKVDMASVMNALSQTQEQLKTLDKSIREAKDDTAANRITAGVSGRLKKVFAEAGDDVAACMTEHGALALISLDGYLTAQLDLDGLNRGDSLRVVRQDGSELTGTVEESRGGITTVLISDNGPDLEETVTIYNQEGTQLGQSTLSIHSPLAVTGYAGTIQRVQARENALLSAGSVLFTLTDTRTSANYDALLRQREEAEETLLDLLTLYRDGGLLAPWDGLVSAVSYDETLVNSKLETNILTLYPQKKMSVTISVDETDILSLKEGQTASLSVSSVSEDPFTGAVAEIRKTADTSTGVTQYAARIELDRAEGMLAGMTASVDIQIQGTENALIIPVDALHQNSASHYVYTAYNPDTHRYEGRTEVTIGMQNDDYVEITSGLSAGDTVCYTESSQMTMMDFFTMAGNMEGGKGGMGGMDGGQGGGMSRAPHGTVTFGPGQMGG